MVGGYSFQDFCGAFVLPAGTMDLMRQSAFELESLRQQLRPFRLHWFTRLRSTNSHAAVLRRRGELFAPAVVLAGCQTAGRGRGQNGWFSGSGSLTVTFAFPAELHLHTHQLPLVAGLAVRDTVDELLRRLRPDEPSDVQVKWPNDIWCQRRKIAGLLCERLDRIDLIGVGLNVNLACSQAPKALRSRITSLLELTGQTTSMNEALICLANSLRSRIMRRGERLFAELLQEYDRHHALIGQQVTIAGENGAASISGYCQGLDDQGRLVLTNHGKKHHIIAGHVVSQQP